MKPLSTGFIHSRSTAIRRARLNVSPRTCCTLRRWTHTFSHGWTCFIAGHPAPAWTGLAQPRPARFEMTVVGMFMDLDRLDQVACGGCRVGIEFQHAERRVANTFTLAWC